MTPCLRQQPQDRQHSLLDARKLADHELTAQALHLVGQAVVERGDQVWRAPRRRQEVVSEDGHGHRSGRAEGDVLHPGGRTCARLNQDVAGTEQLDSGLRSNVDDVDRQAIEHTDGERFVGVQDRLERKRSLCHLDHGQRDRGKLHTFVRRKPTRELEFGIEETDSMCGSHRPPS
jgi:hypothetical protein